MAKSMIILGACVVLGAIAACEASPAADSLYSHWTSFKAEHGKQYASPAEEAQRLELFTKSKLAVDKFNREQSQEAGYTLAVNHLSDKTDEEFKQLLGFKMAPELMRFQSSPLNSSEFLRSILENDKPIPMSIDWRKFGRVSAVKDQGRCGSCWAFSTAGLLEGQELPIKHLKKPISLSPQNIMDCGAYSEDPCRGGNMFQALNDIAEEGGIESDSDYPYKMVGGDCQYSQTKSVFVNKGALSLPANNEVILRNVVGKYGPVSAAMEVNDQGNLRHYKSGVYTDKFCHTDSPRLNHAILIVGYGTDPEGGDYWLVKNSWSDAWGDEGYFKLARNQKNMCGIATFPVVAKF